MIDKKFIPSIAILIAAFTLACGIGAPAVISPTETLQSARYEIFQDNCYVRLTIIDPQADSAMIDWGDGTTVEYSYVGFDKTVVEHNYPQDNQYHYVIKTLAYGIEMWQQDGVVTITGCSSTSIDTPPSVSDCQSAIPKTEQMVLYSGMDSPAYLYLYTEPSLSAPLTNGQPYGPYSYDVEPGTALFVRDGPVCAEGLVWWKVQNYFDAAINGWTPEASNGITLLFPCEGQIGCMSQIGEAGPPDGGSNP